MRFNFSLVVPLLLASAAVARNVPLRGNEGAIQARQEVHAVNAGNIAARAAEPVHFDHLGHIDQLIGRDPQALLPRGSGQSKQTKPVKGGSKVSPNPPKHELLYKCTHPRCGRMCPPSDPHWCRGDSSAHKGATMACAPLPGQH